MPPCQFGSGVTPKAPSLVVTTATVIDVGVTEELLLAANPDRQNAIIQNHGTTALYVYFETGEDATAPILLPAGGPSVDMAQFTGVYRGPLYGIRLTGTGNAGVIEETY